MDALVVVVSLIGMTGIVTTGIVGALTPTLPMLVLAVAWARPQDWRPERATVPEPARMAA